MTQSDSPSKGTQESANSKGSDNDGNQEGRSTPQYATVDQVAQLNQSIESLRRAMQSDKDKGIKRVESRLNSFEGDVRTALQRYAQEGKSAADVVADLEAQEEQEFRQTQRELVQALREGRVPGNGSGGTGQQGVDVSAVLAELELDANDTRVQEFRSKQFTNPAEAYREAAKLQKQILTKQPSDADNPSRESKRQSAPSDIEALQQEYNERSAKLHGQALLRYKREMRAKGLLV